MIEDVLTERAISWLTGLGVASRVAMLFFIYFALTEHLSWKDAAAITFGFYLIARALLRMRAGQ